MRRSLAMNWFVCKPWKARCHEFIPSTSCTIEVKVERNAAGRSKAMEARRGRGYQQRCDSMREQLARFTNRSIVPATVDRIDSITSANIIHYYLFDDAVERRWVCNTLTLTLCIIWIIAFEWTESPHKLAKQCTIKMDKQNWIRKSEREKKYNQPRDIRRKWNLVGHHRPEWCACKCIERKTMSA